MKKKILMGFCAIALFASCTLGTVFAESGSNSVNGYNILVTCNNNSTSHSVVPQRGQAFPIGKGSGNYTVGGIVRTLYTGGTSYQSYWNGSIYLDNNNCHFFSATTSSNYGGKATAYY